MSVLNPSIFKVYDIRGIYPTDLNEHNFEPIIRAIYSFFLDDRQKERLTVVLGRDMRISSPVLFETAKRALVAMGATVVDIGLASTPTFYFAVLDGAYDIGIQITASHNPKDYGGIKFVKRQNDKIIKIGKNTGMDTVRDTALANKSRGDIAGGSVIEKTDALMKEVQSARQAISAPIKPFKIVCDPANGMGGLYVERLFQEVGGELIKMNFELDGTFPAHPADPLDFKNLAPLAARVKAEGADLGIAPDGDGDRVFFIDEKGSIVPATFISALMARQVLREKGPHKIIADIRYTRNVENVVKKYGGEMLLSRVGHAFITEDVNKSGAYFAGESSGHFYFGETGGAESSVRVILSVLEAMSRENKPLSEILNTLQTSYESGEYNFKLREMSDAKKILDTIVTEHKTAKLSRLDGIAIEYPTWRFSIRTSNTEPLMRLNVEANTSELSHSRLQEMLVRIKALGGQLLQTH